MYKQMNRRESNQMKNREVVSKLVDDGYYILYENLEVRYLGAPVCEFDIVGMNFIVDVKTTSFNNSSNKTINFLYAYNLLPKDYIYFVYSPLFTDNKIKELKEIYTSPSYIFINNLEKIKEYVSPMKNIECNTTRDLANLLWSTDDEMNKIRTIYVPYTIYKRHYDTLVRLRDTGDYNTIVLTGRINKIDSLVKENKLVFDKSHLENLFPFSSGDKFKNSSKLKLNSLDKIVLYPKYYSIDFNKEDKDNTSYKSVNKV